MRDFPAETENPLKINGKNPPISGEGKSANYIAGQAQSSELCQAENTSRKSY
jgi:hypothetical protein